ncbi:MAG: O-methyltransferase [Bacteroidetes bacterium]|jgi:caffeoyl-CoA O-methyltransferase|nr:O-methyltransferase [Bacteroidota bacterium]
MNFTDPQVAEYSESFTLEESETLKELVRKSEQDLEYTDMLCGRQLGVILRLLIRITGAKRVLEIGTFTGYSAISMAEVLPDDGELVTLEMNERYQRISKPFFSRPPFKNKIRQILGNALETIITLVEPFDLVFLDADKVNYPAYYELSKPRLKQNGLMVIDNVLWNGEVIRPKGEKARAIHRLNRMIRNDVEVEQVMIPLRDGVTILQKREKPKKAEEDSSSKIES